MEFAGSDLVDTSAIVVPMPAAEPVVRAWRRELGSGADLDVSAHVTVLYLFVPPRQLGDRVRGHVDALALRSTRS